MLMRYDYGRTKEIIAKCWIDRRNQPNLQPPIANSLLSIKGLHRLPLRVQDQILLLPLLQRPFVKCGGPCQGLGIKQYNPTEGHHQRHTKYQKRCRDREHAEGRAGVRQSFYRCYAASLDEGEGPSGIPGLQI